MKAALINVDYPLCPVSIGFASAGKGALAALGIGIGVGVCLGVAVLVVAAFYQDDLEEEGYPELEVAA